MDDIFINSKTPKSFKTEKISGTHPSEHDVFHRHGLLDNFDQSSLEKTRVTLIGAGGLGSEIGMALARKGVGEMNIYDSDTVDITNLARQHFFKGDLYKPKAYCLAENLAHLATGTSLIQGIPLSIQEAVQTGGYFECDIVIVGVDNNDTRFFFRKQTAGMSSYRNLLKPVSAVCLAINLAGRRANAPVPQLTSIRLWGES